MKEKDKSVVLATRQTGKDKHGDLKEHPLFSVGEDFYTMYHKDKDKDSTNIKTKNQ